MNTESAPAETGFSTSTLCEQRLVHGYWGALSRAGGTPGVSIASPDQFDGGDTLSLACTQTYFSASDERKLLKAWCALLPQLKLKTLIFTSRVNQALFDAATQVEGLQALSIKWSGIKSIRSIVDCAGLSALKIGSTPSLTGLEVLPRLQALRSLNIENVRQAQDLSFAAGMPQLLELGVSGSMWSDQKIDSLRPLEDLPDLQVLWLVAAKVQRDGLIPLHGLPRLAALYCGFNFRAHEFADLRAAVATLRYGSAFDEESIRQYCKP
jgi:hypothetical protein